MGEIAADPAPLDQRLGRAAHRRGVLVAELDPVVDEIADRLHALPAGRRGAEHVPGGLHQSVGLAVAAGEQEHQRIMGQVGDRMLVGSGIDALVMAAVGDDGIAGNAKFAGRCQQAHAFVANVST